MRYQWGALLSMINGCGLGGRCLLIDCLMEQPCEAADLGCQRNNWMSEDHLDVSDGL